MKLLIAGIDPGTVSAYALLDLDGNVISINSERQISCNEIVSRVSKFGKIFVVSSDVYPCPNLNCRIAKSFGAKIISPDRNLNHLEKIKIVDSFLKKQNKKIDINNKHERDALAAALYGLRRLNTLKKKIHDHLKENNKEDIYEEILEKVFLDNLTISDAVKSVN